MSWAVPLIRSRPGSCRRSVVPHTFTSHWATIQLVDAVGERADPERRVPRCRPGRSRTAPGSCSVAPTTDRSAGCSSCCPLPVPPPTTTYPLESMPIALVGLPVVHERRDVEVDDLLVPDRESARSRTRPGPGTRPPGSHPRPRHRRDTQRGAGQRRRGLGHATDQRGTARGRRSSAGRWSTCAAATSWPLKSLFVAVTVQVAVGTLGHRRRVAGLVEGDRALLADERDREVRRCHAGC